MNMKKKLNMAVGRFQPFTQGHLNMINEGEELCIVYRINSTDKVPDTLKGFKVGGRVIKKDSIQIVADYIDNPEGDLTEQQKELLKRPFTNELIDKELDIVKRNCDKIIEVVPVLNAYQAFAMFNKFILDHQDEYEPNYWMCGDDRVDSFKTTIDKDEEVAIERGGQKYPNVCKGKLKTNIGKGRTEGVSGTTVRKSILNNDKAAFSKIMPKGVDSMFNDFVNAFHEFKGKLLNLIKESHMSLRDYVFEHLINKTKEVYVIEGGQAGHMAHPFDYTDFTANDLIQLVNDLFSGKVEHMKEKLDGFNIMATMNNKGDVVFIRNKSNLNSENGGMSIQDMMDKWAEKEHQKKVFKQSGDIITTIFKKLGKSFFNPDSTHRKVINCECIVAGKTNILPYASDKVAFHGYQIYELQNGKWNLQEDVEGHVDDLYKAAEGIDAAKPRQDLVIRSLQDGIKFAEKFNKEIVKLWNDEGLTMDKSVEDWKHVRFKKFAPEWCREDDDIFNRICNDDKSVKATELKNRYPEHKDDIAQLEKSIKKEVVGNIMEPMDTLFLSIGNELIDLLDGFINSGTKDKVITTLKQDLESTIDAVEKSNSDKAKDKLQTAMRRLQKLNDKFNVAEGIVIMYKGRRMKFTGSFAALNQALGTRFELE